MTDKELRDAAWLALTQTTDSYPKWKSRGFPQNTHWAEAKRLLDQIGVAAPLPPSNSLGVDRTTMLATAGTILREDNSAATDPLPGLWGQLVAQVPGRLERFATDGDTRTKASGQPRGDTAYRRFTVVKGDSPGGWGARTELGRNEWQNGENAPGQTSGTFALGREGERRLVFWSMRLTDSFDLNTLAWQQIIQWKQCQPYDSGQDHNRGPGQNLSGGVGPELMLYAGLLRLHVWWEARGSIPAPPKNQWIRCCWDTTFSQWPNTGKTTVYADIDADGNWNDANEIMSWNGATLAYTPNGTNGIPAGGSLYAWLGLGPYRNDVFATSAIEFDNVQVVG